MVPRCTGSLLRIYCIWHLTCQETSQCSVHGLFCVRGFVQGAVILIASIIGGVYIHHKKHRKMQVVAPMPELTTTNSGGSQEVFNSNEGYDEQRQDQPQSKSQSRQPRKKRRGADKASDKADAPKASTEATLTDLPSTVIVTDEETADLDAPVKDAADNNNNNDTSAEPEVDGPAVKTGDWQGGSY